MIRYYTEPITNIQEPIFRKLVKFEFNDLLNELQENEEIIGIFERANVKIAVFIDSHINYDKFINEVHSGHFTAYEFFAKKKDVAQNLTPSQNINLPLRLNFALPPALNFSSLYLTIEQKVILPDHLQKVEKAYEEKRLIANSLREEVRQDIGIAGGSTPTVGNSGESIKIKSRSGSLESIKKSVSFHNILTQEFPLEDSNIHQESANYQDSLQEMILTTELMSLDETIVKNIYLDEVSLNATTPRLYN
jgi:uncharacterized protein (UPF0254 family)